MTYPFNHPESAIERMRRADEKLPNLPPRRSYGELLRAQERARRDRTIAFWLLVGTVLGIVVLAARSELLFWVVVGLAIAGAVWMSTR